MSETVGPKELAKALGVSERHIYRLHELGMPKDGRGEYPIVRCARWYREQVLSGNGDEEVPDLGEARLRKAKVRALEEERKVARRKRELIPAEVWEEVRAETNAWLRETVLSWAPAWAERLEGAETPPEVLERLDDLVREGLEELQAGFQTEGEGDDGGA